MEIAPPPGPIGAVLLLILLLVAACVPQGPAGSPGESRGPQVVAAPGRSAAP